MNSAATCLRQATPADGVQRIDQPMQREAYRPTESAGMSRLVFPGPRMHLETVIEAGDRLYALRGIFAVEFRVEPGDEDEAPLVIATHRTLPVEGHGLTPAEALESFCETFDVQWRNLVDVDERDLTEGGRRRRRAMQDAVEAVRAAPRLPRP
jgi:hypothetical protein